MSVLTNNDTRRVELRCRSRHADDDHDEIAYFTVRYKLES